MPSFRSCSNSQPNMQSSQSNQSTTSLNSLNTTTFNQDFEAQVNSNMNPIASSSCQSQKAPMSVSESEFNEKMAIKDQGQNDLPPRFSTIFDTKLPAKLEIPTTPTRAFESYPQQTTRKSGGVYIAKPLFWALFAIFLLESATLFAYTIVGLVNNMQSQLIHTNGAGAVVVGSECNSQPINISPNFYMAPQAPVVATTTLSTTITASAASTSSPTSSTPSPTASPSSSTTSSSASVDASRIADLLGNLATKISTSSTHVPSTKVVVVTPPGPTIKSTRFLTVDPSGSTILSQPPKTSTKIVDANGVETTLNTRDEPTPIAVSTTSSTTSSSGPGITISPIVVTTASDGRLVSVSIITTSTRVVTNKPTQDAKPESLSASPVSTVTSHTSSPTAANPLPSILLSLHSHGELAKSTHTPSSATTVSTATSSSSTSTSTASSSSSTSASTAVPSMTLSLKSHGELANKPTQTTESATSSTTTSVSTTTSSSSTSASTTSSSSSASASPASSLTTESTSSSSTSTSTKESSPLPSSTSTSTSTPQPTTQSASVSSTPTPTPTPTITTTTPAPTPEVISTFTITGPTQTLAAPKAKASCDHKKILGVNAIGCSLPADALDHPADTIKDIFGGIGK